MLRGLRTRIEGLVAEWQARLVDLDALESTLRRLVADGALCDRRAAVLRAALPGQIARSRYILTHLGAHLAIGAVFAFDVIPIPLGTVARVSWVAASRLVESGRRHRDRARIHSVGVLLIAAIPWFGYSAYLFPLRHRSAELTFVLANHTWLVRRGRTYERFLADTPAPIRRLGRWLVPLPSE